MKSEKPRHAPTTSNSISRRRFLAATGTTAVGLTILEPSLVRGAAANSRINVGLIGCGGRGRWIAQLFRKHGGYNLVAMSDYFKDRLDSAGGPLEIPEANRYPGLNGYRKLLEQKLDAVMIETPPYFHPEQAAEAVDAGKHVYLAKPVAVDVPGCLSVQQSAEKATSKRLCFLVDFQTRANKLYQDAVKMVHDGEIGKIISVEAAYHCGFTFDDIDAQLRKNPNDPEMKLRAWGVDRVLSGDIITEQNIHAIDVASWILRTPPVKAYGTGGKTREFVGNCWDRFAVIFYYPNDVFVSFNSHQSGFGYDDILCRVFGLTGTVDTHYFGNVTVRTKEVRTDGNVGGLYESGAVENIKNFHQNITRGVSDNSTVPESVRSNLTTILGRMAAYKNTVVTWDEMMRANEKFVADLKGLKS